MRKAAAEAVAEPVEVPQAVVPVKPVRALAEWGQEWVVLGAGLAPPRARVLERAGHRGAVLVVLGVGLGGRVPSLVLLPGRAVEWAALGRAWVALGQESARALGLRRARAWVAPARARA